MVIALPATVTEALRPAGDRFGAAVSATLPMPVPVAPLVTVIQLAALLAVQLHAVPVITLTGGVPPPAPSGILLRLTRYPQGAPCCVTGGGLPAARSVAL